VDVTTTAALRDMATSSIGKVKAEQPDDSDNTIVVLSSPVRAVVATVDDAATDAATDVNTAGVGDATSVSGAAALVEEDATATVTEVHVRRAVVQRQREWLLEETRVSVRAVRVRVRVRVRERERVHSCACAGSFKRAREYPTRARPRLDQDAIRHVGRFFPYSDCGHSAADW
jgi:hypothetical protein